MGITELSAQGAERGELSAAKKGIPYQSISSRYCAAIAPLRHASRLAARGGIRYVLQPPPISLKGNEDGVGMGMGMGVRGKST